MVMDTVLDFLLGGLGTGRSSPLIFRLKYSIFSLASSKVGDVGGPTGLAGPPITVDKAGGVFRDLGINEKKNQILRPGVKPYFKNVVF